MLLQKLEAGLMQSGGGVRDDLGRAFDESWRFSSLHSGFDVPSNWTVGTAYDLVSDGSKYTA